MNLAGIAICKRTVFLVLTVLTFVAGFAAFFDLGRLEDPDYTLKTALVLTSYAGASPAEVEEEVTCKLEKAVQQLAQLKVVRSESRAGSSILWVEIKDKYDTRAMPQVWDELRRKVGDAALTLPSGAGPPVVKDDFGDVYGVFFAITGQGYTRKELADHAELLKRELLLVPGVAKVSLWGDPDEAVFVELSRARMARLGVSMAQVAATLNARNLVTDAGRVRVGDEYLRIAPSGLFESVDDLSSLLVAGADGRMIRLGDIARVARGEEDPPDSIMRFNGKPAVGLGISTVPGGNVVDMGRAVRARLAELEGQTPVGMELDAVSFQGETVQKAVNGFLLNLAEALAIVIGVLLLTMGLRSGLIIGVGLLQTVAVTFVFMALADITLQRVSLGALILALGMLVDNAIVVTEGILIKLQRGAARREAATSTVAATAWPLLGATVVAVLAFAPIGTSQDATGEFCRSLFQVLLISLSVSWLQAVTVTPLLCHDFLRPSAKTQGKDPYGHPVFRIYRGLLLWCLRRRLRTIAALGLILGLAFWGFTGIPQNLFPDTTRPQFYVDFWRPEGSHIRATSADMKRIERHILDMPEVDSVATLVGQGALRFMLTYDPETPKDAYGQLLVTVHDHEAIDAIVPGLQRWLDENFPEAEPRVKRFVFGPPDKAMIEARFSGPDPAVLRSLARRAEDVMSADPGAHFVRNDWRQMVKVARSEFSEVQARRTGLTRPDVARAIAASFSGLSVGVYREGDDLLPIVLRAPREERSDAGQLQDVHIHAVPLRQVAPRTRVEYEYPAIQHRHRKRTITAQCDPVSGTADALLRRIRGPIEAIPLPPGYELDWGGDHESSQEALAPIMASLPVYFTAMFVITVMLFNAIRQPVIIFACLPLALIGVSAGLLATGLPMGFMAILGFLSLSGMLIKNAIVLLDQIDAERREGKEPHLAITESAVSRVRPVCMAALTTILGMIPLVPDAFFVGMAVTIMAGLTFATVLTLVVVPVLYALFYRVRFDGQGG
ncbi:efflux RND transporter permease subunit [Desulfocurvus sp. DL9XJH121]